jgi:hypothetical protein
MLRPFLSTCFVVCFLLFTSTVRAEPQWIRPGEIWPDARGQHVQAHGGGIIHLDGVYYWFGEDRSRDLAPPETNTYFSQSTMMVKVVGTKATTVILPCGQWKPHALWESRFLWMPLGIRDAKLWLPQPRPWTLDIQTGESVLAERDKPNDQP